jgi:cell filamentation protein
MREVQLLRKPLRRTFDLEHLRALHGWLFQDVYEWAGAIRSVAITKGRSVFARPLFIEEQARIISERLHSENLLRHASVNELPAWLASYYGDLNALHPFREGNGRTQRFFFSSSPHAGCGSTGPA